MLELEANDWISSGGRSTKDIASKLTGKLTQKSQHLKNIRNLNVKAFKILGWCSTHPNIKGPAFQRTSNINNE